ncbi:hypothetical protein KBY97_12945 [Synechococcus sp. ATX 2A4]|nr:hypothetical protein [Synechococcus sp. ATX 2A4]
MAVLATMHGKQRAIARPLRAALGLELVVPPGFDTDAFGSFCGAVARPGTPLEACRRKAERALETSGCDLALASEGAFGPHPAVAFLPCGLEWMVFLDASQGLVIADHLLARRTNFDHCTCRRAEALADWPARVGFPSHALLVRPHQLPPGAPPGLALRKGITGTATLEAAITVAAAASIDGLAQVETDMRAHRNPTRMASIRALAFRLARRIATPCPACRAPGWGRVEPLPGLPCSWCGTPTSLLRAERFGCVRCEASEEHPRSDGLLLADPQHCPHCNP